MSSDKIFSKEEIAKHNTLQDCWLIIDGSVYDVTKFLPLHPAGKNIIL
jgi:cytochrome b5